MFFFVILIFFSNLGQIQLLEGVESIKESSFFEVVFIKELEVLLLVMDST